MRTKQLILASLLCGPLMTLTSSAQGAYFGIGAGYGFPAAKESLGTEQTSTISGSTTTTDRTSRASSFGKGLNAGVYFGVMINKNVGAELGLAYLMGGKTEITNKSTGTNSSSTDVDTYSGSMLRVVPAIRMTAGEGKLRPYTRVGLIVGLLGKVTHQLNSEDVNPVVTHVGEDVWVYKGGVSLGFHGALGVMFALNDQMGIFGEIAGNYQNWAPKKASLTVDTYDGTNNLPDYTTSQKEVEFLKEYSTTSPSPATPGEAQKTSRIYLPFSSIGINIGLHISLGGGAAAHK